MAGEAGARWSLEQAVHGRRGRRSQVMAFPRHLICMNGLGCFFLVRQAVDRGLARNAEAQFVRFEFGWSGFESGWCGGCFRIMGFSSPADSLRPVDWVGDV